MQRQDESDEDPHSRPHQPQSQQAGADCVLCPPFEIYIESPLWQPLMNTLEPLIVRLAARLETQFNLMPISVLTVGVQLTDDDRIQALNHEFRQQNRPTDILSWPSFALDYRKWLKPKGSGLKYIADFEDAMAINDQSQWACQKLIRAKAMST